MANQSEAELHQKPIRTQSKYKQRPEAREKASRKVVIGFSFGASLLSQSENKITRQN